MDLKIKHPFFTIKKCMYWRWLFAINDIKKGTIIEISPIIPIPLNETKALYKTKLIHYSFYIDRNIWQECICLGYWSLFNHSKNNNIETIRDKNNLTISFKTTKNIKKYDQLFIDYWYNIDELELELINNKNL